MDLRDLYNENRQPLGRVIGYNEKPGPGEYFMVVHVCLFNSKGQMLIQERQCSKTGWPCLWDVSVGGRANAGETSRQTAERETMEELGLVLDLAGIRPSLTVNFARGFDDYYIVEMDLDIAGLVLQEEEVRSVQWANQSTIKALLDAKRFIPYHRHFIPLLFEMRGQAGAIRTD
jgi:isopentenyldiphosphate isomerase